MALLDTPATLTALHRTNAIAKARRLAINEILREARGAGSLEALRNEIERIHQELSINEANVSKE